MMAIARASKHVTEPNSMDSRYGQGNGETLAALSIYVEESGKNRGPRKGTEEAQAMYQKPFHWN